MGYNLSIEGVQKEYLFCPKWHRLRVVPHFSLGIVERAKRERAWKSPHARKGSPPVVKGNRRRLHAGNSPRCVSPFLAWGDFHARSRFARSTIPKGKWGATRSLKMAYKKVTGRSPCTKLCGVHLLGIADDYSRLSSFSINERRLNSHTWVFF